MKTLLTNLPRTQKALVSRLVSGVFSCALDLNAEIAYNACES